MSPTPTPDPRDDLPRDTPPHGVPPVSRATVAQRFTARGNGEGACGEAALDDQVRAAPADRPNGRGGGPGARSVGVGPPDGDGRAGDVDDTEEHGPVRAARVHAARAIGNGRGVDAPDRRHARLTNRGRIVALALAVLLVIGGFLAWYEIEANPFGPPGKPVLVDVHAGEPLGSIMSTLTKDQVIGTSFAFHLWSVVHGSPVVRPGTYQLHRNLSFSAAKSALDAGPNVVELTVLPGTTISEIANELASLPGTLAHALSHAGASAGVHSPFQQGSGVPLEGLIGTGTYRVLPGETGQQLLQQMVSRFQAEAAAAGLTPTTTANGLNAYQLVTLASIAQKEGYFNRYMGDVARVIFNRLASGMHLDMTSTVLYSLGKDGGPVTSQDQQLTTPYNTYLHAGLTPTPICTPSVEALRAAVNPPPGPWLYFDLVTQKKGIMKFASTYTGQLALEQEAAANAAKQSTNGSSTSSSAG
jgi:UPF0755 protein